MGLTFRRFGAGEARMEDGRGRSAAAEPALAEG
jgi:hypothetical protein